MSAREERAKVKKVWEVFAEYGKIERFDLLEMTHEQFPKWRNPGKSSIPMSPREILEAQDIPDEEIRGILQDMRVSENVERALGEG